MWGGQLIHTEAAFPQVADALYNIIENSPKDPKAGLWVAWTWYNGSKLAVPELYYADATGGEAEIFEEFRAIDSVSDTTGPRVLAEFAKENMETSPSGLREVFSVMTTKIDRDLLAFARDLYYETTPPLVALQGVRPTIVFQGITVPQLRHMKKHGGNPLGLDAKDGPLFLILVSAMWEDEAHDAAVYGWISDMLTKITAEAERRGVENDYVYMNYGSQFQDVVASYGASNKAKLKRVAEKYDPQRVFQELQPGYFKLDRAPVPDPRYPPH